MASFVLIVDMNIYFKPDEEDWCVVAHKIPVTFLRVELDSESPRVSETRESLCLRTVTSQWCLTSQCRPSRSLPPRWRTSRPAASASPPCWISWPCSTWWCRESPEHSSSPHRKVTQILYLKVTKGPGTLGVYNSLWDSLPVEVCELLHEDVVLQQDGTSGAHSETVELVRHRGSMSCRQLVGELHRRLAVSRTLTSHISLLTPLLLFCLSSWLVAKSLSDIVFPLSFCQQDYYNRKLDLTFDAINLPTATPSGLLYDLSAAKKTTWPL